jgi:hypothetical protein
MWGGRCCSHRDCDPGPGFTRGRLETGRLSAPSRDRADAHAHRGRSRDARGFTRGRFWPRARGGTYPDISPPDPVLYGVGIILGRATGLVVPGLGPELCRAVFQGAWPFQWAWP